jgi:hypothetical protein
MRGLKDYYDIRREWLNNRKEKAKQKIYEKEIIKENEKGSFNIQKEPEYYLEVINNENFEIKLESADGIMENVRGMKERREIFFVDEQMEVTATEVSSEAETSTFDNDLPSRLK